MTLTLDKNQSSKVKTGRSSAKSVEQWVTEAAELLEPDEIFWCSGSAEEKNELISQMVESGTMVPLDSSLRPNSFFVKSDPSDVARVESQTFVCSDEQVDAGPTNNWEDPVLMKSRLKNLCKGAMRGRTLYVVPFSMGPLDSPLARIGVQITDSPYVVVSLTTMVRVSMNVLDLIDQGTKWVKCLHTVGSPVAPGEPDSTWPCNETKYISHFPETREIWSFGSAYGGNALLPKKAFALRLASVMAKDEGWMAEHMLLVKITSPEGKSYNVVAAFPSACGKTNFAMMQPTQPGWKVETLGDDIAWLAQGPDGRLRAINPEAGFFGVAPGTGDQTNPVAMKTIASDTIFTNVALTSEKDVWWEGMAPKAPAELTNWLGESHDPKSGNPSAHPNARFTTRLENCPSLAEEWNDPSGVRVDAIIFGGRRSDTMPLVLEARDWNHGVFLGATMASEKTAAAEGKVGEIRRDPFAMLPFCGYNMGDYMQNWLDMGNRLRSVGNMPRIFHVNWFQKDQNGSFIWPGFGENCRVIEWIVSRIEGKAPAKQTPIGSVPSHLSTENLELDDQTVEGLLAVDSDLITRELDQAEAFLGGFGDRLPREIMTELYATRKRLSS